MTLEQRAAELIAAGYYVAPARVYALLTPNIDPRKTPYTAAEAGRGPDLNICLGAMRTGRYAYKIDLDTHNENQNADTARAGLKSARPELESKIDWHRSRGQKGWHGYFISTKRLDTGKLYDLAGNHIGELLGADTDRTLDPGTLKPPTLHSGEVERLFNVWHVKASDPKGERWADRAKQGERWARGYQYIPVSRQQLRTFLQNEAGKVGRQLDSYFDQPPRNRSDAAGSLMQNLMFFARRLPGCANASFHTRCANVMAYWMAAKSFGKANDTDYSQEKDGWSLIAQIVNQDPYGEGKRWACPSWVDSTTATAAPAPQPAPAAPRAAHRPAGDRTKHLATFRRVLEAIQPDDFGRRTYTLEQLADKMKIARCKVGTRTIQSYLHDLRKKGEIVTAQIGGNGIPYAFLKPCFGGAINYEKRVEIAPESPADRGADRTPEQPILTPQSAETTPQCKEDHQDPSAPPPSRWVHIAELRAWVVEAFDAYPGRASIRKVQKHVEMLAEGRRYASRTLQNMYADERDRRAWERQIAKLQTMKYSALTKLSRQVERIIVGGKDGPEAQRLGWAQWYQPHIGAELDRRLDMKERLRPGKRRGATVEEILILAEIDEQRRQPLGGAQSAGDPLPRPQARPTAPIVLQPDLFADAPAGSSYYLATLALADRLKQARP